MAGPAEHLQVRFVVRIAALVKRPDMVALVPVATAGLAAPVVAVEYVSPGRGPLLAIQGFVVTRTWMPATHSGSRSTRGGQQMTETFRPGDVVKLKSGGPKMTVTFIDPEGHVGCAWFQMHDNPKIIRDRLVPEALERA